MLLQVHSIVQLCNQNHQPATNSADPAKQKSQLAASCEPRGIQNISRLTSRSSQEAKRGYCLRTPKWLARRCFELAYQCGLSSLQFRLTTYSVVEHHSPAFKAVSLGDLDELGRLLEAKQVNPLDEDISGWTLFTYALQYQHLHIAQFLIVRWPSLGFRADLRCLMEVLDKWGVMWDVEDLSDHMNTLKQLWDLLSRYVDFDEEIVYEVESSLGGMCPPGPWVKRLPNLPQAARLGVQALARHARMSLALFIAYGCL